MSTRIEEREIPLRLDFDNETIRFFADAARAEAAGSDDLLRFLSDKLDSELLDDCIEFIEGVRSTAVGTAYVIRPTLDANKIRLRLASLAREYRLHREAPIHSPCPLG